MSISFKTAPMNTDRPSLRDMWREADGRSEVPAARALAELRA